MIGLVCTTAACQQLDQTLPLSLDPGDDGVTTSVGTGGGTISVPPNISVHFPAGSYSGTVTIAPRNTEPFPPEVGEPVGGTAFDMMPAGTLLPQPARVELAVPYEMLEPGDEVRLGLALLRSDLSVTGTPAAYDVTNGILTGEIDEIGSVAAVVLSDAIPVGLGAVPPLGGGSFPPPTTSAPSGPALAQFGGVEYTASCAPDARRCFSSGIVRLWADDVVRSRLGDVLFVVNARVEASLEFFDFDLSGRPQSVFGELTIEGRLRGRVNSTVTTDDLATAESTGFGMGATPTGVTFSGATMVFAQTSDEVNTAVEYGVQGIGTSDLLTVRLDGELEFDNSDGTTSIGYIVAHLRMRR